MTRKDYIAAAKAIQNAISNDDISAQSLSVAMAIAHDLADIFAQDNPRFDRIRFLCAVGGTK